jgi:hypothetical protein
MKITNRMHRHLMTFVDRGLPWAAALVALIFAIRPVQASEMYVTNFAKRDLGETWTYTASGLVGGVR